MRTISIFVIFYPTILFSFPATAQGTSNVDKTAEAKPETTGDTDLEVSANAASQKDPGDDKKKKKRKKLKISARIHTVWKMDHENTPDDPRTPEDEFEKQDIESAFSIRRARLKISWRPKKWLTAVLKLGGFQDMDFGVSLLQDAYIHVSPFQFLEIRVGQFKKPFSKLELRSSGKLRVYNRGEGNSLIVEDLLYGSRDLGIQLSGRIVPAVKLDYEVGVFNGSGPDISEQGNSKDIAARLKISPLSWFGFGVNGSFKFFEESENEDKSAWATSADMTFKVAGFRAYIEGITALDHDYLSRDTAVTDKAPYIFNLIGILSYKHTVNSGKFGISLEPVFKLELLDPNAKVEKDHVLVYNPGFNTYIGEYLRLMIHGEFRRSAKNSATRYPNREILAIQFCFDI
jgi:hypothetical protein